MRPPKPIYILVGAIAWTIVSTSRPLPGQSVGDTLQVDIEPGTPLEERKPRGEVFGYFCLADPVGQFQDHVDRGYGAGLAGVVFLREDRLPGLRIEADYVVYGRERRTSYSFLGFVSKVETTYSIVSAGLGPQWSFGSGRFRPYLYGAVGVSRFFTQTEEDVDFLFIDVDDDEPTTVEADHQLALIAGGGLSAETGSVTLDLSASYQRNGLTGYLAEGAESLIRSEANLIYFRLGISFPHRGKSSRPSPP